MRTRTIDKMLRKLNENSKERVYLLLSKKIDLLEIMSYLENYYGAKVDRKSFSFKKEDKDTYNISAKALEKDDEDLIMSATLKIGIDPDFMVYCELIFED